MKAEKYEMPASEAHHIIERHFQVMEEEQLITHLRFVHAVLEGPALAAALNRGEQPAPAEAQASV